MTTQKLNKKGALGLSDVPMIFLTLIIIVVIAFAGYLVLAGLNASSSIPVNSSAEGAILNFTLSMDNVVSFAPVWGTIIGVAVLIGIVLISFRFGRSGGDGFN